MSGLWQEKESSLLEFDEDSQSILGIIRDTTSHSLLNSKTDITLITINCCTTDS